MYADLFRSKDGADRILSTQSVSRGRDVCFTYTKKSMRSEVVFRYTKNFIQCKDTVDRILPTQRMSRGRNVVLPTQRVLWGRKLILGTQRMYG